MKETVRVTLRYICTADSQVTITTSCRISPRAMERIILVSYWAIRYVLKKKGFIKAPTSKKEWLDIATEFDKKWNFDVAYSGVLNRRGGRNKWEGWKISAKIIKSPKLIHGEVGINREAGKNTSIRSFIEIKLSKNIVKTSTKRT